MVVEASSAAINIGSSCEPVARVGKRLLQGLRAGRLLAFVQGLWAIIRQMTHTFNRAILIAERREPLGFLFTLTVSVSKMPHAEKLIAFLYRGGIVQRI
jgi:hypothetical protein